MASFQEIKKQMTDKFMADTSVQAAFDFTPNTPFDSKFPAGSIENMMFDIVAEAMYGREYNLESWRSDVESAAAANRYGTKEWWHAKVKAWQDGDMVQVLDGVVAYPIVDETKQKITFVALVEEGRTLYAKVAQGSVGALSSLTQEEVERLQDYINDIKPIGIRAVAQSFDGDQINIPSLIIYYDGERNKTEVETEIRAAINSYLANIVFGGKIYKSKIIEAIAAVSGVKDVLLTQFTAKIAGSMYEQIVTRTYQPKAGWAQIGTINISSIIEM